MTTTKGKGAKFIPVWIKTVFIVLLLSGVSIAAWQQLPRTGVSTDLSVIGTGKPTLVLTRDTNFVGGGEVLDFLRKAQTEHGERVYLRIAHQGQADGLAFSSEHKSRDGDLVLLDATGDILAGPILPQSYPDVEALLSQAIPETSSHD
ncbi:MAG: hypothetical protein ACJAXR_000911 [Halopseudomonas sp.]|jgi:hypothetical protein|uniref:hypothetical protein n=1 Tax=Halopseudomonas sp. TaxID=2901191 RepID=UPI0039E4EE39